MTDNKLSILNIFLVVGLITLGLFLQRNNTSVMPIVATSNSVDNSIQNPIPNTVVIPVITQNNNSATSSPVATSTPPKLTVRPSIRRQQSGEDE